MRGKLSTLTNEKIDELIKILNEYKDPLDGYVALDYYDGEKVYFYKPEPIFPIPYKIKWDKINK